MKESDLPLQELALAEVVRSGGQAVCRCQRRVGRPPLAVSQH